MESTSGHPAPPERPPVRRSPASAPEGGRAAGRGPAAVCVVTAVALLALSLAAGAGGAEAVSPSVDERLAELGVELPEMPAPIANYVRSRRVGNLVFLAGHGPLEPGGGYVTGKVGRDLTLEQGYRAARLTAIALLSSLRAEIGDLDRVKQVVRVFGMVNATPEFTDHSKVVNGCSDFLVEVFGERGKHARAAVGMASLPIGLAVEIEMIVEVE